MVEPGIGLTRLWAPPAATRPGPRARLSAAAIVQAGLRVARDEGLDALTMARVAEVTGCSKMALYRHVSDRNDLLAVMADSALGAPPAPVASQDWRSQFTQLWDRLLAICVEYPWLLDLPDQVSGLTPRNLDWLDAGLAVFSESSLPLADRLNTVLWITENIRFEARRRRTVSGRVNDLDSMLMARDGATASLSARRYPHLLALIDSGAVGVDAPAESADLTYNLVLIGLTSIFKVTGRGIRG
ncbi:MAG: TetR/AcrR family transcriptional regulator [Propioniciclava sp.]